MGDDGETQVKYHVTPITIKHSLEIWLHAVQDPFDATNSQTPNLLMVLDLYHAMPPELTNLLNILGLSSFVGILGLAEVGVVCIRRLGPCCRRLVDALNNSLQDVPQFRDRRHVSGYQVAQAVVPQHGCVLVAYIVKGDGGIHEGVVGAEDVKRGDVDYIRTLVGQFGFETVGSFS